MKFTEITQEEFKRIEDNFPLSNFYQTTSWAKIKQTTGWIPYFIAIKEGEKVKGACLLLAKKTFFNQKLFYAPRGPLLDYTDTELLTFFTNNIKKFIKAKKGYMLKIDPMIEIATYDETLNKTTNEENYNIYKNLKKLKYHHIGFTKGYGTDTQFRWTYCLNIKDKTIDDIMKNLRDNTRRSIKKSYKYPLTMEDVDDNNIDDFKLVTSHTANRQHHFDRSKNYYQMINKEFENRSKLIIVYLDKNKYLKECKEDKLYDEIKNEKEDKIPISTAVFIFDKTRVNYVYGGSIKKYMSLCAQYKFQYEMIKFAIDDKYPIYDFGGISGNFEDINDPHFGIYGFKKGFRGYISEYIGEFDLIIRPINYNIYKIAYNTYKNIHKYLGKIKHD